LTGGLESLSGDAVGDGITYYTPWFAGVRLGLSYIPELGAGRSADPSYRDGIAFRANFDRRFDRFGIGVEAGYTAAEASNDVAVPDMGAWTVAARVDFAGSFGGLRVSGGFKKNNDPGGDLAATAAGSGEAWNIGARYLWSRNDVRLAYGRGDNQAVIASPGDDEHDAATLSYARTFGRGVKWSVNLY
jgi:predicted porin